MWRMPLSYLFVLRGFLKDSTSPFLYRDFILAFPVPSLFFPVRTHHLTGYLHRPFITSVTLQLVRGLWSPNSLLLHPFEIPSVPDLNSQIFVLFVHVSEFRRSSFAMAPNLKFMASNFLYLSVFLRCNEMSASRDRDCFWESFTVCTSTGSTVWIVCRSLSILLSPACGGAYVAPKCWGRLRSPGLVYFAWIFR